MLNADMQISSFISGISHFVNVNPFHVTWHFITQVLSEFL